MSQGEPEPRLGGIAGEAGAACDTVVTIPGPVHDIGAV
jgi:hypothetical protein